MPELDDWLRRTATRSVAAPAIVEEDRVTSFGELLARVEATAATLIELGVREGDRVALVLPKNTEAIIHVFATLFAGAVYVPIQPSWPRERIAQTLEDCAAKVVIVDSDEGPRAVRRGNQPSPQSPSGDTALMLFTSGSTGRPKGVVLSHAAVAAFVKWCVDQFQIGPQDRLASPSPLNFDLSTFDVFSMALCGATCMLIPDHIVWLPRFLVQFVRQARITCWYSVPSILAGMIDNGGFAGQPNPDLRVVLFAGEVFPAPKVALLQSAVPDAICANLYGPTETNVVTWHQVSPGFDSRQPLPIGRPCPYAEVKLHPDTGELLAGGGSLMNGYWNLPEDTARAFVEIEGKRYYRTGDRAAVESGEYMFLGRLDRQVKRRGFRIELGEIEAALGRHDGILEAAAVASQAADSGTVISAFIRSRPDQSISVIDVKGHCARLLPHYMLPDHIVFLDAIPRGNRGKIDYEALKRIAEEPKHGN